MKGRRKREVLGSNAVETEEPVELHRRKEKKRAEADYAESYSPLILLECTRERGNISINYCVIKI